MRGQHQGPPPSKLCQLRRSPGEGHQCVGVEHHCLGHGNQRGNQLPPTRFPAEAGADRKRISFLDQIEELSAGRLIEGVSQRLKIGLRLHQGRHRIRRGHCVHQTGPRGECRPRRHPDSAGHAGRPTDYDHATPRALVIPCLEPAQPFNRLSVGN